MKTHSYHVSLQWTGNTGKGTESYRAYERSHEISVEGKKMIEASSDPSFRGDKLKYNPEEMFVASLSSCHMLWFLHVCSEASVIVLEYSDVAVGKMEESADGNGKFSEIANYSGIAATDWSWGSLIFDADNDGWNDIYVCNGINHDLSNLDFLDFFSNEAFDKMKQTGRPQDVNELLKKIPKVTIFNDQIGDPA